MLEETHADNTPVSSPSRSIGKAAAKPAKAAAAFSVDVDAGPFRRALAALVPHCEVRNTTPILGCVTLKMDGERLVVAHRDIDMAIASTVPALGTGDAVAVPLRTLAAFMSGADGATVQIRKSATDERVTFTCGDFSAAIIPMRADDAPELKGPSTADAGYRRVALAEGVMNWLIGLTMPFVSTEETRYYLNGVAFEFSVNNDGMVRAIATDGHRLGSRQTKPSGPLRERATVIIPRAAIKAIAALARNKEVTLSVDDTRAELTFGDFTIRTKLIDGTFPDWRRVVPRGPFKEFELDAGRIIKLHRASKGVRSYDRQAVKIERCEGGMSATANNSDFGSVSAVLRCERSDDIAPFGLSGRYFSDMAKAFGTKRLRFGVTAAGDPVMIRGVDGPAGEFGILMPMRI
ncbi:DNA polymerase III subunit beta [Mesorhizobium sp.]|uniref:DNA polymerase III subunit beta n=1 Tax=Mesorhizobium sp. TaxID=1871066 RepID=UPI00257BC370|nr:DNA polymerase III subunit beta [Mesorhizobium sp.]